MSKVNADSQLADNIIKALKETRAFQEPEILEIQKGYKAGLFTQEDWLLQIENSIEREEKK